MSATVQKYFYKKLLTDRVVVPKELSAEVELKGTIVQYTDMTCSKDCLLKKWKDLNKVLDDNPTITLKGLTDKIKGAIPDMYIGNLVGRDDYKGKDLNVVCTPNSNPAQYILTALVLGVEFSPEDLVKPKFGHKLIEWGGYEFVFSTYDNLNLREIQLSIVQSKLIQAVGRARLLREDAMVKVYSNMPVPNAIIMQNW